MSFLASAHSKGTTIMPLEPGHDGVVPFLQLPSEKVRGEYGNDRENEEQRAQKGEGYRPRHRRKKPSLDPLQSENRKISQHDDKDGEDDGFFHLA